MCAELDSVSESSTSEQVYQRKNDEWEDIEPDYETTTFLCLFENKSFQDLGEFLRHCQESHDFDFWKTRTAFGVPPVHMSPLKILHGM